MIIYYIMNNGHHLHFSVQYAEFVEKQKKYVVKADNLYSKVLKRDPTNEAALLRHQVR